jgi:hypothetical protein
MDHEKIYKELSSVGITCYRIEVDTPVTNGGDILVSLVLSAHGKTATDPEVIALREYLKADSRWDAYVACRKAVIQAQRAAKFQQLTDVLVMDLLESAVTSDTGDGFLLSVPKDKWNEWKAAKAKIRADLPYEVS